MQDYNSDRNETFSSISVPSRTLIGLYFMAVVNTALGALWIEKEYTMINDTFSYANILKIFPESDHLHIPLQ